MMQNLVLNSSRRSGEKRQSLLESYFRQENSLDIFDLADKTVDMFFNHWGDALNELPMSFRNEIMKLGRPKNFGLQQKVIDFNEQNQQMYLIVEGNALQFQSPYSYQQFTKKLQTASKQQQEKSALVSRPNFSNLVRVGTILLKFVQSDPMI